MAGNDRAARLGDRDKALEAALAQIERQFGRGSIMRLGDDGRAPIEVIPTGAIALDVALGIGGLPRGRVVEIYGPEGSGKCLTADTYVWTDRGLETIAEVFGRAGQRANCTSRVTDVSGHGIRMVNERGELETVAALTHNNRKPVLRLRLRSGRTISVTRNHPLRVLSGRGFIVWRRAGRIREGDTLVSALFGAAEAAAGDGLSEDEAILLGYLAAAGTACCGHSVRFTTGDPEVSGELTRLMEGAFGVRVTGDGTELVAGGRAFRERLARDYGLGYVTAAGKQVPHCVRTAGHKAQRAFLSALFESDGWIGPSPAIGLVTASEELARQVQLMLYGLGIPATVQAAAGQAAAGTAKDNSAYARHCWSVTIDAGAAHRFRAEIGFRSARRQAQVEECLRAPGPHPQAADIPSGLLRDLPAGCGGGREPAAAPYTYEEVTAVEDGGLQPTFDVVLPETHSFVANGMLSHNTTVALHAVANAQRGGGIAAFIDAEHALDPEYARKLGVDTDALLVSQPDTGEQALEIADMLIRSGAIDIIVIDSVAALVPRAEIEGEMGDSHVGLQARLMSQALRKLVGALNQAKTTAVFINQLREKVGVMFGCMSYSTRVTLADGTQEQIGKIVNQRMAAEVLSYDPETGQAVPRKIVNWFSNGKAERFLQFTVARPGNGRAQFAATENHLIRTPGGWRQAGELIPGDRVVVAEQQLLSARQVQVILGSLMGDGSLSPGPRGRSSARFRMRHGANQAAYLDWKVSLLANIPHRLSASAKGAVSAGFGPLPELGELREVVYFGDGKKHLTWDYLKSLTPLALAVWYLDGGRLIASPEGGAPGRARTATGRMEICAEAMSPGSRDRLVSYLRDTHGLDVKLTSRGVKKRSFLLFTTTATEKFQELIAPYAHPSMDHKLLPQFRGRFAAQPEFAPPEIRPVPARIMDIHVKRPARPMNRFDIEVEGSHSYFVDGVMVHNSPETTSGGRALKFYASVRLDVRRIETLKDGTEPVGSRTRVKVVKNKCSPPFKTAEFDILFGLGISREGGLIDLGVEQGIVRKSGAWYTYEGDQLGQGKENARNFLRSNPDLANEIEKKIKEKLGVGVRTDTAGNGEAETDATATTPAGGTQGRALGMVPGVTAGTANGKTPVRSGGAPSGGA